MENQVSIHQGEETTRTAADPIPSDPVPWAQSRYAVPVLCGLLLLAVALVFGQTMGHGCVNLDVDVYVTENPHVQHGLTAKSIAWAFTTHAEFWHPLTWLSLMLDAQLYGL